MTRLARRNKTRWIKSMKRRSFAYWWKRNKGLPLMDRLVAAAWGQGFGSRPMPQVEIVMGGG